MALSDSLRDREYAKFDTNDAGETEVRTTATLEGDINVDSTSINVNSYIGKPTGGNGDFVTARTGATTFTCTTLPSGVSAINLQDIETVRQINATGAVVNTYSRDDVTITCSGTDPTTVTVTGATFGATDTITLVTNIPRANQISDGTNSVAVLARTTGTEQPAVTDDALVVYDVGGGAASVSSQYRATTAGQDGSAVYASATTLTVSGTPFTVYSEDLVYIREVDATGNTANIWVNGTGGIHMEISGTTLTRSGGTDFSANGRYEVGYNGQEKSYDSSTDSIKVFNVAPLNSSYVNAFIDVDTTNVAAAATYYPASTGISMDGYKSFSLTGK